MFSLFSCQSENDLNMYFSKLKNKCLKIPLLNYPSEFIVIDEITLLMKIPYRCYSYQFYNVNSLQGHIFVHNVMILSDQGPKNYGHLAVAT